MPLGAIGERMRFRGYRTFVGRDDKKLKGEEEAGDAPPKKKNPPPPQQQ